MTALERHIRRAAVFVLVGIAIMLASLTSDHPLSFMAFLVLGCPVVLIGILLYLYSLSTARASDEP
jgi:Ca2+/Na+ antiporter